MSDCDECDCEKCECEECWQRECDHRNPRNRHDHRHMRPPRIETLRWVSASKGYVPPNAVDAGVNENSGRIYVARAREDRGGTYINEEYELLPGRLDPSKESTYVSLGKEYAHTNYEVLTNPKGCRLSWVSAPPGFPPPEAVPGGMQCYEQVFIGRHTMDGGTAVGKVHPYAHRLYLGWRGNEEFFTDYEILVCAVE